MPSGPVITIPVRPILSFFLYRSLNVMLVMVSVIIQRRFPEHDFLFIFAFCALLLVRDEFIRLGIISAFL